MIMQPKVQIKGIREGLLITLSDGSWDELRKGLLEHLDQQSEFLRGARLALDVGTQALKAGELGRLRNEISERDLTLWAVLSESPLTEQTAQTLGLATRLGKSAPSAAGRGPTLREGESALLLRRTLRSGFSIKYAGHIVVIGDVNPGAEIIATGDVLVWGRLRGMVHAGADGSENAVVCALDLSPTQLRIADRIALAPNRRGKPQPEMARIENGQVVAEPWDPKRERL
jgi:septum site-determining protein MinC